MKNIWSRSMAPEEQNIVRNYVAEVIQLQRSGKKFAIKSYEYTASTRLLK